MYAHTSGHALGDDTIASARKAAPRQFIIWFAPDNVRSFGQHSRLMHLGYSDTSSPAVILGDGSEGQVLK